MDWRPSSFPSAWSSPASCLWSIMVLIVNSASRKVSQGGGVVVRVVEKALPTAEGRLRPVPSVRLLTVTLFFSSVFLWRSVECSTEAVRIRVQDHALLGAGGRWESVCGEPRSGADRDTLNLSELVAQSDVIFKAFAGHGNDLRDAALTAPTAPTHQRRQQDQKHHQPRWKERSEDFVVRLEPGTVYKGNELFQQLQLNSWRHYFIIWSNGSVEYSHHRVPTQGRSSGSSARLDKQRTFVPSTPAASKPSTNTMESYAAENDDDDEDDRSLSESSGKIINCTAWRQRRGRANESVRPVITEPSGLSLAPAGTKDRTGKEVPVGGETADEGNLGAATRNSPKLSTANERVNLPEPGAQSMEKDSKGEGQIGHALNEMLPVTLIVFGRLVRGGAEEDNSLRVDPYVGLLRWDERLEDALWQALGWSKWSDYTVCSVGCGKGVQQRFRHCLRSARVHEPPASRGARVPTNPSSPSVPPEASKQSEAVLHQLPDASLRTQPVTLHEAPGASIGEQSLLRAKMEGGKQRNQPPREKGKKIAHRGEKEAVKDSINLPSTIEEDFEAAGILPTPPSGFSEASRQNRTADDGTWPSCEGHNIEQRSCNMFDCTGTIDLLTALPPDNHERNWNEGIDDRINYEINRLEQNFTLMISLRVRHHSVGDEHEALYETATGKPAAAAGGNILSVRSKLTTGPSLSINFVTDGHGGLRVIQEKYGLSEMLPVREPALHDGDWHSLALSGRNGGGFVTVYGDCRWINSFVLTKGSIELPQYPTVEVGRGVKLRQLTVVPGEKSARLQCHSPAVPIRDVENRQVTNYFERLN